MHKIVHVFEASDIRTRERLFLMTNDYNFERKEKKIEKEKEKKRLKKEEKIK